MSKYSKYFALEKKLKQSGHFPDRADVISEFTEGKKTSLKDLSNIEYIRLTSWLNNTLMNEKHTTNWQNTPENKMRQKLWVIFCKEMRYTQEAYEEWVIKYGRFHRPINDHTKEQLQLVLVQAEEVLKSFTKSI